MCNKCEELVKCPVGEKRRVAVDFPSEVNIVDAYGRKMHVEPWIMLVDRWPDGHVDSYLSQDSYDENYVHYGAGLTITHCPFCGEKFA